VKYGIWRHENALGNSAEHTVGLAKYLKENNDNNPEIYVETEFQKAFAMCIPGVELSKIKFFKEKEATNYGTLDWGGYENPFFDDIYMPNVYPFKKTYKSSWSNLYGGEGKILSFPSEKYDNKHNLPTDAIVVSIREIGTYEKRVDGSRADLNRFINPQTFFDISLHYAQKGYKVVRIGDSKQTPLPLHPNIVDFAMVKDRVMMDDLFLIHGSKVFLSCDSGIWPIAGGMKKNLVLSNIVSAMNKFEIVDWLPEDSTSLLFKEAWRVDNSFEQLKEAVDGFL